jgi:hypothetical protein
MPKQQNSGTKGCRKAGRNERKAVRKGTSKMSAYVRGKITFEQYKKGD